MNLPEPGFTDAELGPGDTLGRYELLLPVAEGGMARVWAARLRGTRGFSKTVAIKTMLPELSADAQFEKMFLDEARIASGVRHSNVAEIFDLGEERGQLYIVLEWIDGEPLANLRRDAVRAGGMPLGVAVKIVAAVCAGLHSAHELRDEHTGLSLGLVHRDISPQNVLVTFDGVAKVVDFGVAKAAGRSVEKTLAGHVKGKPPYMSPEQASGMDVDRRTDIFALGILLYQLVTGKHPFRGESDLVTLQNIVSNKAVVPPRAYHAECPKTLDRLILKAIEHHAEDRWSTALEMGQALEECLSELPRTRQDDVTRFVQQVSGERGERRRQQIRDAIALAEERSGDRRARTLSGPPPRLGPIDPHRTVTGDRATSGEDVTQVALPLQGSRRMRGWLIGAAVLLVLGGAFLLRPSFSSPPLTPPPASAQPLVALAPAAATSVVVSMTGPVPEAERVMTGLETATEGTASSPRFAPRKSASVSGAPKQSRPAATQEPAAARTGNRPFAPPPVENPGF